MRIAWLVGCCLLLSGLALAQADTLQGVATSQVQAPDTNKVGFFKKVFQPSYPNPERAALLSFVLPGAGQIYNKRFWYIKVPVIYGGSAFLIWRGIENRGLQLRFQDAYLLSLNNEAHEFSNTRLDNPSVLRQNRDRFAKNYQLSYIGFAILHLVQTLEAFTTAHLLEFDMNEKLSLSPTLLPPSPHAGSGFDGLAMMPTPGLRLRVGLGPKPVSP